MKIGIVKDTKIAVADGRNLVLIEDLVDTEFPVYCYNGNSIDISWGYDVKRLGRENVYEVLLDDETSVFVTESQEFMLRDGSYCSLEKLDIGDSVMPLNKHVNHNYMIVNMNNLNSIQEHRLFLECKLGRPLLPYPDEVTHHMNGNPLDNRWENLEVTTNSEHHVIYHSGKNHPNYGKFHSKETRSKMSAARSGKKKSQEHVNNIQKGYIISQAIWMLDNGYVIDEESWNCRRAEFGSDTGRSANSTRKFSSVIKSFDSIENLLGELDDFNHKITEILYYDAVPIYTMSVDEFNNFAILTSNLSGIIMRGIE